MRGRAPARLRNPRRHLIFACRGESELRPALNRQLEIDPRRRKVHKRSGVIDRKIIMCLGAKLLEFLRIVVSDAKADTCRSIGENRSGGN